VVDRAVIASTLLPSVTISKNTPRSKTKPGVFTAKGATDAKGYGGKPCGRVQPCYKLRQLGEKQLLAVGPWPQGSKPTVKPLDFRKNEVDSSTSSSSSTSLKTLGKSGGRMGGGIELIPPPPARLAENTRYIFMQFASHRTHLSRGEARICDSRAPRTLLASASSLPHTSDSRSEADTEPALHFPAFRDFGRRLPLRSRLLNASIFSCQRPKLRQQPLGAPSSVDRISYYIVNSYFIFIHMLAYDKIYCR